MPCIYFDEQGRTECAGQREDTLVPVWSRLPPSERTKLTAALSGIEAPGEISAEKEMDRPGFRLNFNFRQR